MTSSNRKKRFLSTEKSWIQANHDRVDHILFFNFFVSYDKRRAIRRFKVIVENFIDNAQRKTAILNDFEKWNKSKESQLYWKQRPETNKESSSSSSSTSVSDHATTTVGTESSLSVATSVTEKMKAFYAENLQLPEVSNRYFVDDIDVSLLLYNYQKQIYDGYAKGGALSFKSNYHEMLCFSSILLLESNTTKGPILNAFGRSKLQKIIAHIKTNDLTVNNNAFPFERMIPVLTSVQQVFTQSMTREEGCLQLMNIGMQFEGTEKSIVKFIKNMIESFPLVDMGEIIKEDDLKSRYVLPMIQSLFDDLEGNNVTFFKITNENNPESKKKKFDISHRRPDGQFRRRTEHDNLITIGYMEAKPDSESKSHEACMQDLVRLGIFGKNAIDIYKLKNTLLIQVIGSNFAFFLLQKKNKDVYTMIELDKFNFPMNINQIPSVFGYLNRIADVVNIFKKHVKDQCENDDDNRDEIRKTLRSPIMRSLAAAKKVFKKKKSSTYTYYVSFSSVFFSTMYYNKSV